MQTTVNDPVGVEVTGVRSRRPSDAGGVAHLPRPAGRARRAHRARAGRSTTPRSSPSCGASATWPSPPARRPCPGSRDLNVVSNVGRDDPAAQHLPRRHQLRRAARPPTRRCGPCGSPSAGGETLFTNQYRAYDTLPGDVRAHAGGAHDHATSSRGLELGDADAGDGGRAPGLPPPPGHRPDRALPLDPRALRRDQRDGPGRVAGDDRLPATRTRRPRTTRSATPGRRATSSCGTTAASCTAPTTSGVAGDRVMHRGHGRGAMSRLPPSAARAEDPRGARPAAAVPLPVNLAVTGGGAGRARCVVPPRRAVAEHPRTVLVSGGKMTKALALARAFHAAGHRVVLVESRALPAHRAPVLPRGRRVPRVPQPRPPGYADALRRHRRSPRASTCTCRSAARRPAATTRWPSRCSRRTARCCTPTPR